jgi:hypothetical protein
MMMQAKRKAKDNKSIHTTKRALSNLLVKAYVRKDSCNCCNCRDNRRL